MGSRWQQGLNLSVQVQCLCSQLFYLVASRKKPQLRSEVPPTPHHSSPRCRGACGLRPSAVLH